jgi:hypothetical protein
LIIYNHLPNKEKDKSVLLEGITLTTQAGGAKELLDKDLISKRKLLFLLFLF